MYASNEFLLIKLTGLTRTLELRRKAYISYILVSTFIVAVSGIPRNSSSSQSYDYSAYAPKIRTAPRNV